MKNTVSFAVDVRILRPDTFQALLTDVFTNILKLHQYFTVSDFFNFLSSHYTSFLVSCQDSKFHCVDVTRVKKSIQLTKEPLGKTEYQTLFSGRKIFLQFLLDGNLGQGSYLAFKKVLNNNTKCAHARERLHTVNNGDIHT